MTVRWALKRGDFEGMSGRRAAFRRLLVAHGHTTKIVPSELVFGELITNAVRYGKDPMAVEVTADDGHLRIRVEHSGESFDLPSAIRREPTTEGGRGLRIVSELADRIALENTPQQTCRMVVDLRI